MSIKILTTKSTDADYEADILIVNYDILNKVTLTTFYYFDLLICDESQALKNPKAKRTQIVKKIAKRATRRLLLTGTPVLNRPKELLSQLQIIGENGLKGFNNNSWQFLNRYCQNGKRGFDGAQNLEELNETLRANCMILRKKNDVLKDLPAKIRKILKVENHEVVKKEKDNLADYQYMINKIKNEIKNLKNKKENFNQQQYELESLKVKEISLISKIRHETALAKVPYLIEYIDNFLESTNRKLVVFAHHQDVVEKLYNHFKNVSVKFTGSSNVTQRDDAITTFQDSKTCKLFIATINAAGVGITLTAASDVLFGEFAWTPAQMSQAEDRVHRIGQNKSVSVQHIVFDGSIDCQLIETLVKKQEIIDKIAK